MLQEAEKQGTEEANADAGVTADVSKMNEDDDKMIISMGKEQKTLEYQETMKVDVKNITKNPKIHGDQYIKLLLLNFLKFFFTRFLDLCKKT